MGWFSDLFVGRTEDAPSQRFLEGNQDYNSRVHREANERIIEDTTGSEPSQRFLENDRDYDTRVRQEANERVIEAATGSEPSQHFLESDHEYRSRIDREANERVIESATGSEPSQRFLESDSDYRERIDKEANEHIIESATGSAPSQRFLESDDDYRERISQEADEHRASSNDGSSSGGCFITSACVEFAGLPDDCRELTVLRHFRDNYIAHLPHGKCLISEYYEKAPSLLSRIQASQDREQIFAATFRTIQKAVAEIERGERDLALETYTNLVVRLERDYAKPEAMSSDHCLQTRRT